MSKEGGKIIKRFRNIIVSLQGKSKTLLHNLYNQPFSIDRMGNMVISLEKIFCYEDLKFNFEGTNIINSEKLVLNISIPKECISLKKEDYDYIVAVETYLLSILSFEVNSLSEEYINDAKSIREKAQFYSQVPNEHILKRSGLYFDKTSNTFVFKIFFSTPLINAISVNGKKAFKAVKSILELIWKEINSLDYEKLNKYIEVYSKELQIRKFIKDNSYIAFIANGSILPRENDSHLPMKKAIPFSSPKNLEITIPFKDGSKISGMGIKQGVTIITGGGYSGKSTLLDAIEYGIYNHIPFDGREYVISVDSCEKIYAEDGRVINNGNIKPFFQYLPNSNTLDDFSTMHASGSVSEACNIMEAIYSGSKLLLIDEDKSATNFMIRDKIMRRLVQKEPIIPFTDRVREIFENLNVSTILVIGGSSEYLNYADTILMMEDFQCLDITNSIREEIPLIQCIKPSKIKWVNKRYLMTKETSNPFLIFRNVNTENLKRIIIDDYVSDITVLTALQTDYQLNTLTSIMEKLFSDKEASKSEVMKIIKEKYQSIFKDNNILLDSFMTDSTFRFYEDIRIIDIFLAVNRTRGISFLVR